MAIPGFPLLLDAAARAMLEKAGEIGVIDGFGRIELVAPNDQDVVIVPVCEFQLGSEGRAGGNETMRSFYLDGQFTGWQVIATFSNGHQTPSRRTSICLAGIKLIKSAMNGLP